MRRQRPWPGDAQGLVNADVVVMHEVDGQRVEMVFDLLRKGVSQAGKAANAHPHRQVGPLGIAGADMLLVGLAAGSRGRLRRLAMPGLYRAREGQSDRQGSWISN